MSLSMEELDWFDEVFFYLAYGFPLTIAIDIANQSESLTY